MSARYIGFLLLWTLIHGVTRPYLILKRTARRFQKRAVLALAESVVSTRRLEQDRGQIARALLTNAKALFDLERYAEELPLLQEAIDLAMSINDTECEFSCRLEQVASSLESGRAHEAIDFASAISGRNSDLQTPLALRKATLSWAQVLSGIGSEHGFEALRRARDYASESSYVMVRWFHWVGTLHLQHGLLDSAQLELSKALMLAEARNENFLAAAIRLQLFDVLEHGSVDATYLLTNIYMFAYQHDWNRMLAEVRLRLASRALKNGDLNGARRDFHRASQHASKADNQLLLYYSQLGFFETVSASGDYQAALSLVDQLLQVEGSTHRTVHVIDRLLCLAKLGRKDEALGGLDEAEDLLAEEPGKTVDIGACLKLCTCCVECGEFDRAEQLLRKGIEWIEAVRLDPRVLSKHWGTWAYSQTHGSLHRMAVRITTRKDYWKPERALAYSEMDHVGTLVRLLPLGGTTEKDAPDPLRTESSTNRLAASPITHSLGRACQWIDSMEATTADYPRLFQTVGSTTAILEYFVADDFVAVFCIRSGQPLYCARLPLGETALRADVGRILTMLSSAPVPSLGGELDRALESFSEKLFAPLASVLIDCKKLIVIPHKGLAGFPFHLMFLDKSRPAQSQDIVYEHSLGLLSARQPRALSLGRCVVFGVDFVTEAHEVAAQLGTKAIIDGDATIEAVSKICRGADLVHFSCHSKPQEAGMHAELHLGNGQRLGPSAIVDLESVPALVVLSSCESAVGPVGQGGEILSLVTAWLYAGTSSVVASLWPADASATQFLMNRFYTYLLEGDKSISRCLVQAQRDVASQDDWKHPFFWAPFVVFGAQKEPSASGTEAN